MELPPPRDPSGRPPQAAAASPRGVAAGIFRGSESKAKKQTAFKSKSTAGHPRNRPLNLCKRSSIHSVPSYAKVHPPAFFSLPRPCCTAHGLQLPSAPARPRSTEAALRSRGTLGVGVSLGGEAVWRALPSDWLEKG